MNKEKLKNHYGKYNVKLKYFYNDTDTPTYISNYITEKDVGDWKESQPIFISAQTGSGKNYFVKEFLITKLDKENYRTDEDKYFLYLVNRTALKEQLEEDLKESLKTETIEDYDKFVYVFTYQELSLKLRTKKSEIKKMIENGKIKYVVMDECHFFLSDAVFNPHTYFLLEYLIVNLSNAVRIYMSATLEDVAQVILDLEYKIYPESFSCLYYYFERKFNYIENIYLYRKFSEIENIIKKRLEEYQDQKFMIFVYQKEDGSKLRNKLKDSNISCVFISSETKSASNDNEEYMEYKNIVHKERFSSKVLISTSVMDNRVTIKDKDLKNIVIDVFDRVEMLQMLGRIRVKKNQKINLYLRDYSFSELEKLYNENIAKLLVRLRRDKLQSEYIPSGIFEMLLKIVGNKFTNIFMITENTDLFDYNQCAIYQLTFQLNFLREILSVMSQKDYAVNPKNLNYEENRTRINFYGKYTKTDNYTAERYSKEWVEAICRELELEKEKSTDGSILQDVSSNSFFKYVCLSIPYIQASQFLNKMGYSIDERMRTHPEETLTILKETDYVYIDDEKHFYKKNLKQMFDAVKTTTLMYLSSIQSLESSPFPSLEVQLMWLGRNRFSPSVKYLNSTLKLLALSKDEIECMMQSCAITANDYKKHVSKDLKHSGNILYFSFDNPILLKAKGILKGEVKTGLSGIEEDRQASLFCQIIYWLIRRYKIQAKNVMETLMEKMDQQPFVGKNGQYTLRLVRENVKPQDYYYILVREEV